MSDSTASGGPTSDAATAAPETTGSPTSDPTGTETGVDATSTNSPTDPGTSDPTAGTTSTTGPDPGTTTSEETTGGPIGPGRIVAYFTAWAVYDRDYHVDDIPADKLTHVNYAFANLTADGKCVLGDSYADIEKVYGDEAPNAPFKGSFHQLQQLKQQHGDLRTLISVGGYTWSTNFAPNAATEQGRASIASSCVQFMRDYGFDGVDIDWEFPASPQEGQDYSALLAALRAELDAAGTEDGAEYLLTIAAPAGQANLANLDLPGIAASVDWINLMAYDFAGPWMATTTFNAALHSPADDPDPNNAGLSDDAAVTTILDAGVPPGKLVLGVPFYGRSFAGAGAGDNGLFSSFSDAGPGTWEPGIVDYHDIAANYTPTLTRHWHDEARVPWLYDAGNDLFITYDDPESMQHKMDYIAAKGLGGAMFWELAGDTQDSALLTVLADALLP
ncbi:glycoside hydrolase family 18 protein [Nannocystis sp. SCPEA4]|uniref:glycoside hydrolase family 18 protein n=1 Tax=Nannocystis sp. SCPEA4 TaxID=2996787 RepID=UPI00226F9139|nr:glycoside hydrolase family 18 protein [Nannocystis sp. SCPEA4]MCY1057831.1 glycoside hydrolase family 18 protein [Nannocystis sp. SCPEA4]